MSNRPASQWGGPCDQPATVQAVAVRQAWAARILLCDEHAVELAGEERLTWTAARPTPAGGGDWRIRDLAGHRYTLPDGFRLGTDRYVRVHTGRGSNDSNDLYWGSGWYIWNNTGDRATLKNAAGTVIDRCRSDGGGSVKNC